MTNYHLPAPATPLPSLAVQEAKAKRKAVLEKAAAIRKANYKRFMEKRRAISNLDAGEGEI